MPSPFPGMDPYLENPELWEGFHNSLLTYVRNELIRVLPRQYAAVMEMRIYLDLAPLEEQRVADIEVVRSPYPTRQATGAMTLAPEERGTWIELPSIERREAFITIRRVPERRHVTTIELLSPSNKRGGAGRTAYLRKQEELLRAGVNLVEIDLLRRGAHTVLASEEALVKLAPLHYLASVYRPSQPTLVQVFPWTMRESMPHLPVPLLEEDGEVMLDLQAAFTRNYDEGDVSRILNYEGPPDPPFSPDDSAWADELLRNAGLRGEPGA